MKRPSIDEALASHTPGLMRIPGVVGTGIGEQDGLPCILILVAERTAALVGALPSSVEGYSVRIEEVGQIRPLSGPGGS